MKKQIEPYLVKNGDLPRISDGLKEGEDTTKKMLNMQCTGKEKKCEANKETARQHQRRIQYDRRDGAEFVFMYVAHDDKGRPITTWRRPT